MTILERRGLFACEIPHDVAAIVERRMDARVLLFEHQLNPRVPLHALLITLARDSYLQGFADAVHAQERSTTP